MMNSLEKTSDEFEHLSETHECAAVKVSFDNLDVIEVPVLHTFSKKDFLNLTTVVLKGVRLSSLPDVPFINVVKLDLSNNNLSSIPFSYSSLKKLEWLNLSHNQFVSVPHCLADGFKALKYLFLSENRILNLRSMDCLSSLQVLDVRNNEIDVFPECLVSRSLCVRLEEFNLSQNICFKYETEKGIDELLDSLRSSQVMNISQSLKKLTLSNCEMIENFSEILQLFPNLTELDLSNDEKLLSKNLNFFPKMPIATMMNMQNLSVLKLANVSLRNLSDQIAEFKNLKILDLQNNHLNWLPDSFCCLKNLEFCDLSNNELYLLPDKIGILSNLSVLFLQFNALSDLPESFGQLENLKFLDLFSNQISEIPEVLLKLNIEGIDVEDNHFESSSLPNSMDYLKLLNEFRRKYKLTRMFGYRPYVECENNEESYEFSSDSTLPEPFSPVNSEEDVNTSCYISSVQFWDTEVEEDDDDDLFDPFNYPYFTPRPKLETSSRRKECYSRASPPVEGQFDDAESD